MPSSRIRILLRSLFLAAIALGLLLPPLGGALVPARQATGEVVVVPIDGAITPVVARHVERAIDRAEEDGAAAVVLEIDTPGGLSSAMDDIIRDVLESNVPVIAYVSPNGARAASAGTFITYAAHVAAMAPGTRIGSASPVNSDGSDLNETMDAKVTNDAVAQIVNLANLRGRNAEWAEAAVRESVNVTADEALRLGVVDLMADDLDALLAEIDGRTVELASGPATLATAGAATDRVEMTWFEEFLQLLAEPTVAYLLLSLGSLGLVLELSNPGATIPGVVGGISLLLGLFLLGTLPVNWAGVLFIGLGLLLLVVDLFVPSLGILTVGGLVSFVFGSFLLFDEGAPPGYEVSPIAIWTMTACLVASFVLVGWLVARARMRKPRTGRESLVGAVGRARTELAPRGMVFLQGELWQATATTSVATTRPTVISAGTPVVVVKLDGLHMEVRPATADEVARSGAGATDPRQADRREVVPASS